MGEDGCQPRRLFTPAERRPAQRFVQDGCQPGRPLKVGTDCSGLDTPIAALEEILKGRNRRIHHVFSSENDPKTLQILLNNFTPEYHYTDVARRAMRRSCEGKEYPAADELPSLDIYAAGFPCQPWATCGLSAGVKDARGLVWVHIFRFISIALPRAVVLENVKGLLSGKHKATFETMMALLESMDEYDWQTRLLNTQDFGVPQNRQRVYIVGIRRGHAKEPFMWPNAAAVSPQLNDFLDVDPIQSMDRLLGSLPAGPSKRRKVVAAMEKLADQNLNPLTTPAVCSAGNRTSCMMLNRSPCLTRGRAMDRGHWIIHRGRQMTTREVFMLQGLKPERWSLPEGVSEAHLRACAGNAMSGNVIKAVLMSVLVALGEV